MGRKGRSAGRQLSKAYSRAAAAAFASANRSSQPRTVALGDAINALTAGPGRTSGLVIDDETRWMLRDPRDDVPFGPINPLRPDAIDPVRPDTGRPEPRLTEYPVAWNLPGSADAPVPWATLRAAAESVDIIRRCISVRQEQLQGLDWSITLDDQIVQGMYAAGTGDTGRKDIEAELRRKLLPEIDRLTAFWKNPWKANGVSFEQWVNGIMEDHLVLDAVAIYPRTTYGGDLSAFELIDATTIKLLLDYRGARPEPPFPAFQQILYGFPRAEFGSCYAPDGDDAVKPVEGMLSDQLFYFREQYRSFTPYGYSAVQQALISARLYLRRQGWMLAEYDDGSTPLTFLVPDGTDGTLVEKLTPKTRRQWEDSINAELAGQTRARNRMKVLMPGMTPHQMQGVDERYKPDYDMHLIKMLAGHFGVTSSGLGFSEAKGLGNSGLHEGQADVQQAATTKPDKRMIERIVNELMCTYQGAPAELKFKFTDPDTEDQAAQDASADAQRARGTITLNDDRKRIGKSPFTFAEADMPMALLGTGWVPIEGMAARAEQQAEAEQALVEDQLATSEQGRELAASEAEELSGETAEKALELAAYRRWARKRGGDARRPFICKALAPSDFPGEQVPRDVDFAEWMWVPDGLPDDASDDVIEKAFGQGNDNWRTLARDSRGRWVKRGSMRVDALGPSTPDKPVIASLRADASRRRAAAARPATDPSIAREITGSGIVISGRLKGMPAAARQNPPSNAHRIKVGAIGPDGTVTDDQGRAVGALHSGVTPEQAEAGGWLHVDTNVPGASGGFRTVSAWKEPAAVDVTAGSSAADKLRRAELMYGSDRSKWPKKAQQDAARLDSQLRVSDESTTIGGMTTPRKLTSMQHHVLGTGKTSSAGYLIADRRTMPALKRAGLAEEIETAYGPQWVATPAGLAALERADADLQAELNAQSLAKLTPELRARVAAVEERAKTREQRQAEMNAPTPEQHDASVRDVVTSLQDAPGGWVAMADVRRKLEREHGMDRGQQDAALRRLATTGDRALNTAPEDNQKTLTDADHAAAVDFGAGPQHIVSWDPPSAADVAAAARGRLSGEDLTPGDRIEYAGVGVTVLSTPTRDAKDKFGREMWQFRARRDDTGAEGPMLFGDGGSYLRGEPAERSVLDTVRESGEQAAAARAVIDSVPGLREGVARQQPIPHRGGTITPMPPSYEDPNGYVHVVAADGTVLGRRADVATAKLALDNHAKGKPQAGARRMQQSQADRMGITAALRNANVNDPELVTVREEGRQNNPGYALPTTPPAARAEAVAASTPDAPSAAPRDPAELTGRAYRSLLATVGEGGRIVHPQSRKIVETMERSGWKLADVKPGMSEWKHEDGRRITMLSGADKPTFMANGQKLTGKAALEHVESDHRVTDAAIRRVREVKGFDAQMDAVSAELERPGLREHTRRELEALRAKGEERRAALRGPQETPEQRMARVEAEVAQQRADRTAAAQRELTRAAEYVGDVMPATRGDGAALATRLGLEMFNVRSRPDGSFTFALSAPGQSGSARLATFDSARGGWILPGLGGYTFDANDPVFMSAWLHEGTKATHINDNTKRAHKVSELLRTAGHTGRAKPAQSVESMMAANMANSTAAAPAFGAARGKVTGDQIQQGTRVQFRGTAWEVLEKPRRARPDSEGRTGVVFRARREDQGIEGTMRVNDGSSLELAAPKGSASPAAVDARRKPEAIGTRPAAAAGGTLAQRQQVLSAAVTGGVVGERKLGGGQAADTKLVTLADGTKAVHKITTEAQNDHSPRDQVDAEELAGEVAAALGVRTPAMVRTGPTAAYQEFMPGQPGKALYGRDIPDSVLASDDGVRLGLLDHITANSDRHGGNWLVDGDGSLTGIDNGMAFDYRATMGTHNPFGKRHFEDDANPLSPADVARVRERLAALKPRFTAMKRGAWHKAMMARLDEVARGATGTRDFIL